MKELIDTLIEWINRELIDERILVRDVEADLYDGQVLQKLLEKFTGSSLNQPELTQTEMGQRQRLKVIIYAHLLIIRGQIVQMSELCNPCARGTRRQEGKMGGTVSIRRRECAESMKEGSSPTINSALKL